MRRSGPAVIGSPPVSHDLPSQLRVHRGIREIPKAAWDALVPKEGVPFLEYEWIHALEESGSVSPEAGWHPHHLALWQGKRLVAVAPAYLKDDSYGEFVYDWSWASAAERIGVRYYPKLVLAVPLTPATGPRFLIAKDQDRAQRQRELVTGALELARSGKLSSVHVLFPTEEELPELRAAGYGIRLGVQYHWHNRGYATFEDFLSRFQSKRRNQIRRERRAAEEQGIMLSSRTGAELANEDPRVLFDLYASTVDKYLWGRRHLRPEFFRLALKHFSHRLELVEAKKDGRLVAGAINVGSPTVLYGRYWGSFEEHPFLHFNVCQYYPVEQAIRTGRVRFEPGAGGEHKLVRGFEPALTYSAHFLFHPGLDRAVRQFLEAEAQAIHDGLPQWRAETGLKPLASQVGSGEEG